jgi:quercetin dioxygenase-like cupin family protein
MAEGALEETIALLSQGESSARKRALLVEAKRLRSRIASWRAIPPPPATRREAFESAMQLLRKAGAEFPPSEAPGAANPTSTVTRVAAPASSLPPSSQPRHSSAPPSDPLPKREMLAPGISLIRPRSMVWRPFHYLEGVDIKVLQREESGAFRALVRLAPGAEIPRHRHELAEDILMLEGTLVSEGVTIRAGELCHSEITTIHPVSSSPSGCTFLLIGSEKNEILWE